MLNALTGTAHAERLDPEEDALWTLINEYRERHGVQPVGLNDQLLAAAEWMAGDMADKGYFSHTDSLGRSSRQRMADFGYIHNTTTGEALARGIETGQDAFDLLRGSPKHDATMLYPGFWVVGIARAYEGDGWYWVVDLGGRGPAWFPPTPVPSPVPTPTPTAAPIPTATLDLVSVPVAVPTSSPAELPCTGTEP